MNDKFETVLKYAALLVGLALVALLITFAVADKRVEGYYATRSNGADGFGGSCIYASAPWYGDDKVFCSDDMNKVVETVKQLNETVRQK